MDQITFGTNTRQSVIVVQKIMKKPMITNDEVGWSLITTETAAPHTHMITTLYTLMPMYLESFSAGIDT